MSTSAARLAVALLLCLPVAAACDTSGAGGGPPPAKSPGSGGGGDDLGPRPLRIPEWGPKGFLYDYESAEGIANWADIKKTFERACADGTLCVILERVYLTESGARTDGPCGYDRMEPAAGTPIKRGGTVSVVGVCGPESGEPTDPAP
ncbi:hypothetical protein [Streptomyces sp. NPDC094032]|uniref:hypothetical protein n=1 Tax=Streptomyces sp. NPDC094032 TaxID=3155308 RepID=UPI003325ECD9